MLHAVALAAALSSPSRASTTIEASPIHSCLASMDGAVYHGDPTDRTAMRANVAACENGVSILMHMHTDAAHGPEKLFLLARVLDRSATLSFMGLDDPNRALANVTRANLYFRIAAGLNSQDIEYHRAALANVQLASLQLRTLRTEIAATTRQTATVARVTRVKVAER